MTLVHVYRLNAITLDKVKSILEKYEKPTTMADNNQPYVMVIDELNRVMSLKYLVNHYWKRTNVLSKEC